MKKLIMKVLVLGIVVGSLVAPIGAKASEGSFETEDDPIVICIDPGHGGDADGAKYEYDGRMVLEKDLNLSIALALRDELETYDNVRVVMLRTNDLTLENQDRADIAHDNGADYYISVHNNAKGDENENPRGMMVLCPVGYYQLEGAECPSRYAICTIMGENILGSLGTLGLNVSSDFPEFSTNGIVRRPYNELGGASEAREYPDGSIADYYSQLRFTGEYGIPAIVIEHAYISNEEDYRAYLSDEDKLTELGIADARGIATALHLTKSDK